MGLLTLTINASAIPVLDSLNGWQRTSYSSHYVESAESEYVIPSLQQAELLYTEHGLTIYSTYRVVTQEEIELELESWIPLEPELGGRARLRVVTSGHDTDGSNIKHNCRFDGGSSWKISPLQPSPSTYTFNKEIYGSGSRWVLVEGWISVGAEQSTHDQIQIWTTFSLF